MVSQAPHSTGQQMVVNCRNISWQVNEPTSLNSIYLPTNTTTTSKGVGAALEVWGGTLSTRSGRTKF
jgi:hypothetical protein